MLHDLANDDGYVMLQSNGQLRTERGGDTEKLCQKPAVQLVSVVAYMYCILCCANRPTDDDDDDEDDDVTKEPK